MSGNRHNRASTVSHHHVVGSENRNRTIIDRVSSKQTGKYPSFLVGIFAAFALAAGSCLLLVGTHCLLRILISSRPGIASAFRPLGRNWQCASGKFTLSQTGKNWMLGCYHHEGGSKQGIGTGGIDLQVFCVYLESYCRAPGATNPVFLHRAHFFWPI